MINIQTRPLAFLAAMTLASFPAVASEASKPVIEAPIFYGQVSGGWQFRGSTIAQQLRLSTGPQAVELDGQTQLARGHDLALALGRQWHSEATQDDPEPRHWRIEAEWWQSQQARRQFQSGRLQVNLNDRIRYSGLFLNAATRLAANENTRWWVAAGIGRARVDVPDANSQSPGCGCLTAAEGQGTAWRVKTTVERLLSESTALYGELAYTRLPDVGTGSSVAPAVSYRVPAAVTANIGLKFTF